jgi:hypothetical protein
VQRVAKLVGQFLTWSGCLAPTTPRETEDAASAVAQIEKLLADRRRVLGSDDPATLRTRRLLAHWRGKAGDLSRAVAEFGDLVADHLRSLGPENPDTLAARHSLAHWRGEVPAI